MAGAADWSINALRRVERGKYVQLYRRPRSRYGGGFFGRQALPLLRELGVRSVLDVGCGQNLFAQALRGPRVMAVGVDFASSRADVVAAAHRLPFADNSFEWITAFDMLEHLLPSEVPEVLGEFARVAEVGWVFSIAFRDSKWRVDGRTLHPTVRPRSWWINMLGNYIDVEQQRRYLFGRLHQRAH